MKLKITNKKRFSLVCIAFFIFLLIIFFIIFSIQKSKKTNLETGNVSPEPFVTVSENGQKNNISSKIQETKTVENLEFSNFKISTLNNQTTITANVNNTTKSDISGFYFRIKALDESGNSIAEVEGLLDSVIKANSSSSIDIKASKDFANCYDIQIEKVKDMD